MSVQQAMDLPIELISICLFLAMIAIELIAIFVFRAKGTYVAKDSLLGIFLGLASGPANALTAFITFGLLSLAAPFQMTSIPVTWATFALCFVLDDLRFYVHHRIAHRCRWVWAMHVVHHSSQQYNLSVALRQSWTKHFTGTMMLKIPLVLIGFDPLLVTFCGVLNATYQFFLHTETIHKMPRWFEAVFNTPSHHRVHHGANPRYLDANYAGTLIIWDRLFGTFVAEEAADPPAYGLVKNIETYNPIKILFHEYAGIARDALRPRLTFGQRLRYIFAPPGWSHDGSRQTSESIMRAAGIVRHRGPQRARSVPAE